METLEKVSFLAMNSSEMNQKIEKHGRIELQLKELQDNFDELRSFKG
jgi:hypothetical protein